MQWALEHRQLGDSCTGMLGKNEIMGRRENQREGNFQSQKINNRNGGSSERGGNFERVEKEIMGDLDKMSCKEKINRPQNQMETKIESNENGPRAEMTKPRKKKWKYQARNVEGRRGIKEGLAKIKRPSSSMDWESLKPKKSKLNSPQNKLIVEQLQEEKAVAIRLNVENDGSGNREELQKIENGISAVAGNQHSRQP
ncbi:hypothetical protein WN944_015078 [Citrus x changshan-huyou]|uniref:Uncharacterized protein n=1 Tax=Citrus x changshan-huyou TaxID=2935761 RepID=A0AAP0MBT4_9ROSI